MPQRRLLTTGFALIFSILTYISALALVQPSVALAHAYVIGSNPVDGSTVAAMPKEVQIYFDAPISSLSSAHVYFIQGGSFVDVGATPSQVVPSNAQELVIPIKTPSAQPEGGYEVIWSAVANNDGHTTEGIIGFNVGFSALVGFSGTPILGPTTSNDLEDTHALDLTACLAIVWDWLVGIALTAWIGTLVMELFIGDRGRGRALLAQVRGQTHALQRLCLATIFFGEGIALFLRVTRLIQVQHSGDFPPALALTMIAQTNYGHIWLVRMVLIAVIVGFLSWPHRLPPLFNHRVTWLMLVGLLTLLFVFTSSVAQALQPHLSAMLFAWLQILALGIWFGSIAYLSYVLLPLLRTKDSDDQTQTLAALLQRLTPVLLISISMQLLSLFFLSEASIHDPQQLWSDPYGLSLTVQVTLIAIAVLLSAYLLFVLRPGITHEVQRNIRHHLQLTTGIIPVLGAGVLLCSALMSFFAPPIVFPDISYANANQLASPTNAVNIQTQQIGPLSVTLELLPGHIDQFNTVIILLKDKNGQPVTNAQVQLTTSMQIMDMGTGHAVIAGGNPVYAATFNPHQAFTMAGAWAINVQIQLPNQQAAQKTFVVMVS
jgi:methionine-rich copper-binding protein CopC/putative copper export protein